MLYLVCFLVSAVALLSLGLFLSVRQNLRIDDSIEELGTQIEESLDIINDCYQRVSKVTEMPVESDDPVVQQLLADIRYTKHALLLIANKVISFDHNNEG